MKVVRLYRCIFMRPLELKCYALGRHFWKMKCCSHFDECCDLPGIMWDFFLGGLIFLIGFSGCVGALRENTCFLALYSTIIGLLLLAEIAVGALIYVSKDWLAQEFFVKLDDTVSFRSILFTVCLDKLITYDCIIFCLLIPKCFCNLYLSYEFVESILCSRVIKSVKKLWNYLKTKNQIVTWIHF